MLQTALNSSFISSQNWNKTTHEAVILTKFGEPNAPIRLIVNTISNANEILIPALSVRANDIWIRRTPYASRGSSIYISQVDTYSYWFVGYSISVFFDLNFIEIRAGANTWSEAVQLKLPENSILWR